MKYFIKLSFLLILFSSVSCSSNKNKSLDNLTLSYLTDNNNALVFGKIDIEGILNKTSYKEIPKAGVLVFEELKKIKGSLNLDEKVNFILEGPFIDDDPKRVILFSKIKNEDSLKSKILSMGYSLKKSGKLQYFQQEEVSLGFQDELFIVITQKGKYDPVKELNNIFESCEKNPIIGKRDEILNQKADINIGIHYKNIYNTAKIEGISKEKMNELLRMTDDSYTSIQFHFEKGFAEINFQNLFSDTWMKRMVLTKDSSGEMLKKLGKGNANFGLSVLIDSDKLQSIIDDYAGNSINKLAGNSIGIGGIISGSNDEIIKSFWNGKFSLVQVGDIKSDGFIPEFNFFIGLGNKGNNIVELIKSFMVGIKANSDGSYNYNDINLTLNEKEIYGSTAKNNSHKTLDIPKFAEGFGTNGIQFFVNFENIDIDKLGLDEDMKFVKAVKNIRFDMNNEKGKVLIVGKNQNQNILKQIIDVYIDDLKEKIGDIN